MPTPSSYSIQDRRPMGFRDLPPVKAAARGLIAVGATPNAISVASVAFAAGAGASFFATAHTDGLPQRLLWLGGGLGVAARALCNVFDGIVAVETGRASPLGELYNEVPDRFSDVCYLAGLGYAVGGSPMLGWLAACAALLTAYARAQAALAERTAGLEGRQDFCGPMAKPHRMYLTMALCAWMATLAPALPCPAWGPGQRWGLPAAVLAVIVAGSLLTTARRLARAGRHLRAGAILAKEAAHGSR